MFATPPPPQVTPVPEHVLGGQVASRLQLLMTVPHSLPWQATPSSVQPHTFGVPPPPHVSGAVQAGQLTVCPQLLIAVGHLLPPQALPSSVQPHTFGVPPPPQ